jgi:hypothetical protein
MRPRSSQLGQAMALVELQREFVGLPSGEWTVSQIGTLYGSVYAEDGASAMAAFERVLGGEAEVSPPVLGDRPSELRVLVTVWRDVQVYVSVSSPARIEVAA